jgi:L-amino acid N-acyltransferase YncA
MAVDLTSPQGFRRAATAQDQAAVHAIYAHPDVAPMLGRDPLSLADFGPLYADLCSRKTFYVYLVDTIVGCYHISRQAGNDGRQGYLSTVALCPTLQGRGLGRRMLSELIAEPAALACRP